MERVATERKFQSTVDPVFMERLLSNGASTKAFIPSTGSNAGHVKNAMARGSRGAQPDGVEHFETERADSLILPAGRCELIPDEMIFSTAAEGNVRYADKVDDALVSEYLSHVYLHRLKYALAE